MNAETMRLAALKLKARRDSLPDPADAQTDRERVARRAVKEAVNAQFVALWGAFNFLTNYERKLRPLLAWRDRLRAAAGELEAELAEVRAEPPGRGHDLRDQERRETALLRELATLTYHTCRSCGAVEPESELDLRTGDHGETFLACPRCGDSRLQPPGLHDGVGGSLVQPRLQSMVAADWSSARSLFSTEALVAKIEADIAEAVGRVQPVLEAAGLADEVPEVEAA